MMCTQVPPVYGGAGKQALALASRLVDHGYEVDLLTQNQGLRPRFERIDGVTVRRAPGERLASRLPRRAAQVFRTISYSAWLAKALMTRSYSIYHLHGVYWFGLIPTTVRRFRRVPMVVKTTRLGEDDADTATRKRLGGLRVGAVYGAPLRHADAVIALSDEIERRQRELFPGVSIRKIPNGVDVAKFAFSESARRRERSERGIPADAIVFLFSGYLAAHKGIHELLDTWRLVANRLPNAWLLLVGPASGFYRELGAEVVRAQEALPPRVLGLGHLAADSMPAVYAASDVFVLPTAAEGMPNSLLEALASGLKCAVTRVPGVTEVVSGIPSVFHVASLDSDSLAATLIAAGESRGPRVCLLPKRFDLESVARDYDGLYQLLLEHRSPKEQAR
jgi:glycosyltransferase involved in cell wall biosynthesis